MINNPQYSKQLNDQINNQRIGNCFQVDEFDSITDPDLAFRYICKHVKGISIPASRMLAVAVFPHPEKRYAETGLLRDYLTDEMGFDMSIDTGSTQSSAILNSNVHRVLVDESRGILQLIL